jgi:hypothetical protein
LHHSSVNSSKCSPLLSCTIVYNVGTVIFRSTLWEAGGGRREGNSEVFLGCSSRLRVKANDNNKSFLCTHLLNKSKKERAEGL